MRIIRFTGAWSLVMTLLLSGCVTVVQKKTEMNEVKKIRSIALIERAEPTNYTLRPGSAGEAQVVGFALAGLSGVILSDVVRELAATSELSAKMAEAKAAPNRLTRSHVRDALTKSGLTVSSVSAGPVSIGGNIAYADLRTSADALLDIAVSGGWQVNTNDQIIPMMVIVATLAHAKSGEIIFREHYCYGECPYAKIDYLQLPTNASIDTFASGEALLSNLTPVLAALDHIGRVAAQRLVTDSGLAP